MFAKGLLVACGSDGRICGLASGGCAALCGNDGFGEIGSWASQLTTTSGLVCLGANDSSFFSRVLKDSVVGLGGGLVAKLDIVGTVTSGCES